MKRVLVTGATGLIGRQLVPLLVNAGYEVHGVTTPQSRSTKPIADGVSWHQIDLLREESPRKIIRQIEPTGLLHLAWEVSPGSNNNEINREWLRASRALIQSFYENGGVRTLTAGTCFEYDLNAGVCSEEITPRLPATLYASCKDALFEFTREFCDREDLSWAWGRVFFVYGPNEHRSRLVASVALSLLRNEPALCTHGRQVRDYLHSRDVAEGLLSLFGSGWRGDCNIASGTPVTLREVVEGIAAAIEGRHLIEFGARPSPPDEPPSILADVSRAEIELGWRPKIALKQGLTETVDAWRERLGVPKADRFP